MGCDDVGAGASGPAWYPGGAGQSDGGGTAGPVGRRYASSGSWGAASRIGTGAPVPELVAARRSRRDRSMRQVTTIAASASTTSAAAAT
ncbi:hypothetical protein [Actinocatenispora rupis]|uniref:hypothetical protein n=1 Tax=Actinocatenispora rupis TaxID=519421 RepID=UPI0019434FCF|nr:hypothetical protein [Actinocatenispora rupis]